MLIIINTASKLLQNKEIIENVSKKNFLGNKFLIFLLFHNTNTYYSKTPVELLCRDIVNQNFSIITIL
jgi:hypothetical protein